VSGRARSVPDVPSSAALSKELRDAAAAERELVAARVAELREQSIRMKDLAAAVDDDLVANVRLLGQLDEMLGVAPQMSMTDADDELRGQRLRDVAIQILRRHKGEAATMHYRDWYELVVHEGHRVGGKDPVATFLTQVSRAREVEPVGRRSGLYRLRVA
jgi:hypothetical protein